MWTTVCFTQGWANLDQASKHLEVFRFRDLSPTPKPWVLEVLSTQAHLAVLSFGGAIDPGTLICWQWKHPTPNCYLYLAKCRCSLKHLFFWGIYVFSNEASCMTSGCGAIWSDAEKENSWSMNRNRKPENFLDPPNPPPTPTESQIFVVQVQQCLCTYMSSICYVC
jgi:hypothetical protein